APVGEKTSIIQLSVVDPLPAKGIDYLNTLVVKFNEDALNDKNLVAKNTQDFIDERLNIITGELDTVERSAERFKKENRLTDLVTDAGLNLTTSSEYEKALANNGKELMVVEFMLNSIKNSGIDQTIPENIIPTENASTSLINQYNVMVLERNRLLKSTSANHPNVLNYNQQITALKGTIQQSLRNVQSSLTIAKKQLLQQESKFNSKVSQVPTLDRKYRNIERQQNIKEALYLYLRQKQEETAITMAVTSPKAKVIDSAYSIGVVSPNTRNIYLIALLLGLLIPFSVIYLIQLLDTKIHSRHDLEKYLKLPFLGDIPLSETSDEIMTSESRSSTAESFRILLTNLDFMLATTDKEQAKTIFITSTIPKEGKTFVAVNIASTLSLYGKKVLLIGMDLRHPKIMEYIKIKSNVGLSNYLSNDKLKIEDIVYRQEGHKDFWVMPSGVIPPNPAELLNSTKISDLFDELKKQYD
ncbi:MAG TPA: tyrosine protein kinase, partial [Flavobacterium sp.]|nr:tyrosine protein kinase [Flavobacterium sp.]